jgi:D-aspartate ligase
VQRSKTWTCGVSFVSEQYFSRQRHFPAHESREVRIPSDDLATRRRRDAPLDVVLMGLYINASADLRRLSALGYSVGAVTHDPTSPGLRSRHGRKLACPDPAEDFEGWISFMIRLGQETLDLSGRRPALIATEEAFVLALDRGAERLSPYFRIGGFGDGLHTALTSKRSTFELAEQHGFPRPWTRFVGNRAEMVAAVAALDRRLGQFLIKPEFTTNWTTPRGRDVVRGSKALIAETPEQLLQLYDRVAPICSQVVVQEVIPGPDENLLYWAGMIDDHGRVLGQFVGRKLRVLPIHLGSASFVQLVELPEVERLCANFLGRLSFRGRCGIEVKIDARDGHPKLIEINPRTGLWEDIGIGAGVDLAQQETRWLLEQPVQPQSVQRYDRKWVHVGRDLRAFAAYRREGLLATLPWLKSLAPPIVATDMPWRQDWPYASANVRRMVRNLAQRVIRRSVAHVSPGE